MINESLSVVLPVEFQEQKLKKPETAVRVCIIKRNCHFLFCPCTPGNHNQQTDHRDQRQQHGDNSNDFFLF